MVFGTIGQGSNPNQGMQPVKVSILNTQCYPNILGIIVSSMDLTIPTTKIFFTGINELIHIPLGNKIKNRCG